MTSRVAIDARVSTTNHGQDVTVQTRELQEFAEARGWRLFDSYLDLGISGSKDKRPELDRLMADAHRRKFDVVIVWKFDRFARSVSHLLRALETFNALGISFVSLTTAGLAGVAPSDAGAASGLINVMQQLGAALGLAVLVTVFDTVTPGARSAGLSTAAHAGAAARTALVHGIDVTMAAGAGFALVALAIVALLVRTPAPAQVMEPAEMELEPAAA